MVWVILLVILVNERVILGMFYFCVFLIVVLFFKNIFGFCLCWFFGKFDFIFWKIKLRFIGFYMDFSFLDFSGKILFKGIDVSF